MIIIDPIFVLLRSGKKVDEDRDRLKKKLKE